MFRYARAAPDGRHVVFMPDSISPISVSRDDGYVELHSSTLYPALLEMSRLEDAIPSDTFARMRSLLADEARRQVSSYKKTSEGRQVVNRRLTPDDYLSMADLFATQRLTGLSDPGKWRITIRAYMSGKG